MKKIKIISILSLVALGLMGCQNKQVSYDDSANLAPLTTGFSLSDLNMVADKMISSMLSSPATSEITRDGRPILMVDRIQNRTDQHIDTESITDTIRTELIQSGKFRFTDKMTRDLQRSELDYQNDKDGMVNQSAAIAKGQQLGAEYMVVGSIVSYEERTSKIERKSYKFTMNLINLKTGIIEWAQESPITKQKGRSYIGR